MGDHNVTYINLDINAMDYVIIKTLLKARSDVTVLHYYKNRKILTDAILENLFVSSSLYFFKLFFCQIASYNRKKLKQSVF